MESSSRPLVVVKVPLDRVKSLILGHTAVFGIVHEADEGAATHIWQILMAGQIPFVIYFMIR